MDRDRRATYSAAAPMKIRTRQGHRRRVDVGGRAVGAQAVCLVGRRGEVISEMAAEKANDPPDGALARNIVSVQNTVQRTSTPRWLGVATG